MKVTITYINIEDLMEKMPPPRGTPEKQAKALHIEI